MRHVTMASRRTAAESLTRMLLQAGKGARKDLLGAFSGEALDAAGARRDAPPFAVSPPPPWTSPSAGGVLGQVACNPVASHREPCCGRVPVSARESGCNTHGSIPFRQGRQLSSAPPRDACTSRQLLLCWGSCVGFWVVLRHLYASPGGE